MENVFPIEDEKLGILYGRDCIFADSVIQMEASLIFKGEINGRLASRVQEDIWIPYELIFENVIKYSSCELDTYGADENEIHGMAEGSFLEVSDSDHLKKISVRNDFSKYDYKHFMVYTYDYVFHVFAVGYEWKILQQKI